jgi:hypothetical protein
MTSGGSASDSLARALLDEARTASLEGGLAVDAAATSSSSRTLTDS